MPQPPDFSAETAGGSVRFVLTGSWTIDAAATLERAAQGLVDAGSGFDTAVIDLGAVDRLDTAGAWLVDRSRRGLVALGSAAHLERARPEHRILLDEVSGREAAVPPDRQGFSLVGLLADIGESVVEFGRDLYTGIAFFGELTASLGALAMKPRRLRFTSLVFHVEMFAFRSVPIIALINFLVGAIVAQQGIFQLRRFGAVTFTADLIGVLVLRELGVLLTSIMIAGRSGSAITAEIGSMKMREEIDALQVMGLRAMDVLVIPRLFALTLSLPMLTFVADMTAIFGGIVTGWMYGGITPEAFLHRLQVAIGGHAFAVGMIKAPVMALVIGLIAAVEGLKVEGSAESLGRQVTASVVKAIFMVIVADGVFAMVFAAIRF